MELRELAARLGCRLVGDGAIEVTRLAGITRAQPGDLTFLANPRYTSALKRTRASAVILGEVAPDAPCAMLRTPHPYLAFANAVKLLAPEARPREGIHPLASVAGGARIGAGVSVGPFVAIEEGASVGDRTILYPGVTIGRDACIGEDCVVHARVSIREGTRIGRRVILQDGAVVGSDGYAYAQRPDGTHQKVPQPGLVVIEDDVEIGANTTIDRPALGETRIGAGTKIDNLVQIAHGVTIGRDSLIIAQVGIAGSTTIGDNVVLAGQVGVAGHLEIGQGVRATGKTVITNSLEAGAFVSGCPAIPNRDWRKSSVLFHRLPEMRKALMELESRLAALERERAAIRAATPRDSP